MTAADNITAKHIDKKADWARNKAKNSTEPDFYNHLAVVLEALADEIRIGLHKMDVDNFNSNDHNQHA